MQVSSKLFVLGDESRKYGLGESLFQRLYSHYTELGEIAKKCIVNLRYNYHSHKDLLELSSSIFYNSSLIPCSFVQDHASHCPYPLKFICSGFDFSPLVSYYESFLILEEVKKVLDDEGFSLEAVCVVAASLSQVC